MRTKISFNPNIIDKLQSGRLADPQTPGLYLEVQYGHDRTTKVWKYRRRIAGRKPARSVKATLGTYPRHSIADARVWAFDLNMHVEQGIDPADAVRAERAVHTLVADAHALYMASVKRGLRRKLKPRTIRGKEQIWLCDIQRQIGGRILQEITDEDLWSLVLTKGKTAPIRANRLAAELKVFLKWCAGRPGKESGVILKLDPAALLEASYFPSSPRSRHLSHIELDWLLQALALEKRLYQRAILLMLLTGCRKEEVLGALANEFANGVWSIPSDRTKNNQLHRIPLSPWALSLTVTNCDWLIPSSRKDGPMLSGWYKVRARVHRHMEQIAGRTIEHFTFHDLRRTLRSNTKRLKIDFETAEAMLNHKKRDLEQVYDGYDLFDEKQDGYARWEAFLITLAADANLFEALSIPDESRPSSGGSHGRLTNLPPQRV